MFLVLRETKVRSCWCFG